MSDPFGPTDPSGRLSGSHDPTQPFGSQSPGYPPQQPGYPPQQPYGQQGYAPPSSGYMGQAPAPAPFPPVPAAKRSRRRLWITLGIVLVLLIALVGGALFAFGQYLAPAVAAGVFCGELKARNYPTAYQELDKNLQGQFTQSQFTAGAQALDQIEGNVTGCAASNSGSSYRYSLGSSTAAASVTITRSTAGALTGTVHLKNENGWKVDALDTTLLGVNLGALKTAGAFCAALQSSDYSGAYALLGSQTQTSVSAAAFALAGQAHDQIDGSVSSCGLVDLGQGNSDTSANLVINITRAKLGAKQGPVTLDVEGGAWKITAIDAALQGTDIAPLAAAAQLCTDVVAGNLTTAYALTSTGFQSATSQAEFNAFFALGAGQTYAGCAPVYSTYQVTTTQASFDANFTIQASSGTADVAVSMVWTLESGAWKLQYITVKS